MVSIPRSLVVSGWVVLCLLQNETSAAKSAPPVSRVISFELDPIEDAVAYEVEISKPDGKKVGTYYLKKAAWSGRLPPGKYRLRSRSTDSRGVHGDWSDYEAFEVFALAPRILAPLADQPAQREEDGRIQFAWEEGAGAVRYLIEIKGQDIAIRESVSTTSFGAWLPKGAYTWSVSSLLPGGVGSEKSLSRSKFEIVDDLDFSQVGTAKLKWEAIKDAKNYEVEIKSAKGSVSRGSLEANWEGLLPRGDYQRRIRATETSGNLGSWSEFESFTVLGISPAVKKPTRDAKIDSGADLESEVEFAWDKAEGAERYRVEAVSGETRISDTTSASEIGLKLPVGRSYSYRVIPIAAGGTELEARTARGKFDLLGKPLLPPQLEIPITRYVTSLSWKPVDAAKNFDYRIERLDRKTKSWSVEEEKENFEGTEIPFSYSYPGGRYRLAVKSVGNLRKPSEPARMAFNVNGGDRRPEATYQVRLRESMERPVGIYFLASYLVTSLSYVGDDPESNSSIAFNAFGGTGRIGFGYHPPRKQFGGLGIVDLSGFRIAGRNYTFAAAEGHLTMNHDLFGFAARSSGGLFYKELAEVKGSLGNLSQSDVATIASVGPHIGIDLTRPLVPGYGLQLNARIYVSALGVKTPNGGGVSPALSYQIGFMGSKRLKNSAIGYLGYAYRVDSASYQSTANDDSSSTITSLASPGALQRVSLTGHYLNLLLELGF